MDYKKADTEDFYKKLMSAKNAANKPHFNETPDLTVQVKVRPDKSISPAMFKPDPLFPGHYKAHPVTIAAMRKDLFMSSSDGFIDLEQSYICGSCKHELDLQFWLFCPFCEEKISHDGEA